MAACARRAAASSAVAAAVACALWAAAAALLPAAAAPAAGADSAAAPARDTTAAVPAAPATGDTTALAVPAAGDTSGRSLRWTRVRRWSVGGSGAVGLLHPADLDRAIDLADLAFATSLAHFRRYRDVEGEVRYGVTERLSLEARAGYLWREESSGRFARRVSAIPVTAGATWYLHSTRRLRAGPAIGGGLLWKAKLGGDDPLGGIEVSGRGPLVEGGGEGELFLARSFAASLRVMGRWAVARRVLPDGGDIDLSGVRGQVLLRVYLGR